MSLLEVKDLSMTFQAGPPWARRPVQALRNINLSIAPGEVIGLVGESGSGKSTLGNIMIARMMATSGQVTHHGEPLHPKDRRKRAGKFAAVLQHPKWSLNPMLRVSESVIEPLKILGQAGTEKEQMRVVGYALEQVGMPQSYQDRFPHELSGGQRQRVSIARALVTKPEFVLFDEAVSALDVSVQAQVLNLIKSLQAEVGFSALFISHDLAATRYVASRIAVLYAGQLVEDAPAKSFYGVAAHPYSQGLQYASALIDNEEAELKIGQVDLTTLGCPLVQRCPKATSVCKTKPISPQAKAKGHLVACHHV